MKFGWIDSALVRAIEQGEWVLIDNANFCAPSVLDRLNPLLEKNGRLQINEKGIQPGGNEHDEAKLIEVKPHPNFRLILSLNETFGELSRPMRNRGLEIYIPELDLRADLEDALIVCADLYSFSSTLVDYAHLVSKTLACSPKLTYPELLRLFKLAYDYWLVVDLNRNVDIDTAMSKALVDSGMKSIQAAWTDPSISVALPAGVDVSRSFFADLFKLREFSLYRFLYNFPLFSCFVRATRRVFDESSDATANLNNMSSLFMLNAKWSNLAAEWCRALPLSDLSSTVIFTRAMILAAFGAAKIPSSLNRRVDSLVKHLESIYNVEIFKIFK